MNFKVKSLEDTEEKSVQETEAQVVKEHEASVKEVDSEGGKPEEVQEDTTSTVEETVVEADSDSINEERFLSYFNEKYNKKIELLDDLVSEKKKDVDIPEEVKGYLEYKSKTGRGFEDYVKLNQDFSEMGDDDLIGKYLLQTGEALDEEDLDILMDDYSFDEDSDDEKTIKKKKLAKKKAVKKALDYFNDLKETYKKPVESAGLGISKEEQEEFDTYKQYIKQAETVQEENQRKRDFFLRKTDEVFSDFKGFEFTVGDEKIVYEPKDNVPDIKKANMDSSNFIKKFMNKDGMIEDARGYHKALYIAMNPDKFAKFFYEKGQADGTENYDRTIKNIDMSVRSSGSISSKEGVKVKAVNPSDGRGLRIKGKK